MLLATQEDVGDRLGHPVTEDEEDAVEKLLEEASVAVEEYIGHYYEDGDTVPRAVSIVVSRMVARRMNTDTSTESVPDGVNSLGATDFQAGFAEPFVSMGVWLNRFDKMMLRRYRVGAASVQMSSDRY